MSADGSGNGTVRVLHVDDDSDFAETAAALLERADGRLAVETATDAAEGLDRLVDTDVDCVVSDYEMPGRDGIEFLEAVREEYPELPFVLYTGKGSEEIASEAVSAGVTDYLQKTGGTSQYTVLANRIRNAVERYRSKREIEASRERLSLFFDQSPLGVIEWNDDFEIRDVNGRAEEILGYTEAELVGNSWEMIVPEADRGKVSEVVSDLLDDDGGYKSVNENVRKDGERIVCEWYNRVVTDEEGRTVAIYSQFQDVTERTERESELQRKERRYQAIFNDPHILAGLVDTDGTVLDINQTAMEYVDATLEDVVGTQLWRGPWFDHSAEERERVKERIDRAARGEYVEFEGDRVDSDGETYTVEGVFRPVTDEDGEIVSLFISSRDVTSRKARERELEAERDFIEQSLNTLDDIFYVVDTDGDFQRWNETLSELTGYDSDEIGSMNALEFFEGRHRDAIEESIAEILRTGSHATEAEITTKDGRGVPHGFRGVRMTDADGEPTGIIGIARDITERKARERELERERDRLEEFASIVSHDLRNPLNVASGRLEIAKRDCEDDRLREHLEHIGRAHDRMNALIEDLLLLAREGDAVTDHEPIDLTTLFEDCWRNVETADARLRVETDRTVLADRSRLKQVFENLFRNAVEHGSASPHSRAREDAVEHGSASPDSPTREDGVERGGPTTVTVGDLADGFYVEDDGPGIPPERRESVFETGYSTDEDGTGFGLSIVQGIVEAHGWEIEATDAETGGARFEITGVGFDTE